MSRRSMPALGAALLPLSVGLVGCGGAGGDGWQGTVTDSAGVEVVSNTGSGVWADGEGWTVQEDLVIGTAEGDPEYQFGQIAGIDVDADGRIYVLDQQAREVRVFGPDGQFLRTMGQEGSGPGELSQAAGPLFVGPGDTVTVPDAMQQRLTRYTASGEPAGSHPLPMTDGIPARWLEAPDEDLLQQAMVMQLPGQTEVEPKNLILRRSPNGAIEDTVMELPASQTLSFSGGQPSVTLFEAEPVWAIGQDGRFFHGINRDYRLTVRSPNGQVERIVARTFERRAVTEGDQAEYRRILAELWRDQGMPPEAVEMMSQAIQFAGHYPAYANVVGGPEGTLWVQGIQTPDEVAAGGGTFNIQDIGSATWEVFDREGRFLGTVRMPPRFNPLTFVGDDIYGVMRDDLDVQYATRMRVNRGPDDMRPTG